MGDLNEKDVAIVGYGPVGAALAGLLALAGCSVLVLEREAAAYHLPRAVHLDDEVMRLLQTLGVAAEMAPRMHVNPGMRFVNAAGQVIIDWPRPLAPGPQGWHASYRFHQPELERTLRAAAAARMEVTVRTRADVFALDPDPAGVRLRYEDLASGRLCTARARYVVGCDGARSLVRRCMAVETEDLGFHQRWLVIDAILKRPRPDLGDYSVQYCGSRRPATYVRGTGDRRRWEIALHRDEDGAAMTAPAVVASLLAPWLAPGDAEIERATPYVFHSVIARDWRRNRLLLAGDSAHQTPPFLGQGMCAGMRDAANLAWKLAAVCRGAPAALLDSYQAERAPHVREYIALAVRLGHVIMAQVAGSNGFDVAASDGSIDVASGDRGIDVASGDRGIDVASGDGGPKPMRSIAPRLGGFATRPEPTGRLAAQPLLADGTRLDDRVGYRHALLRAPGPLPPGAAAALRARGIVDVADVGVIAWLSELGADAALLRPDRYITHVGTLDACVHAGEEQTA